MSTRSSEAMPLAQQGQNRKKALLDHLDGNDTDQRAPASARSRRRFARAKCWSTPIGIDGKASPTSARAAAAAAHADAACRFRFPGAGAPAGRGWRPIGRQSAAWRRQRTGWPRPRPSDDRVNVAALRDMTDDSGGRTEIVARPARSQSGDGEHRRRVEQAVLPRLSVQREEGRPLALDPRRAEEPQLPRPRRRGYVAS